MKEIKTGQIVKFHTPNYDEDPEQLYLVLEFMEHGEKSRARIQTLNTGVSFPWTTIVYAKDLEVDEVQTFQLDYYLQFGKHQLF